MMVVVMVVMMVTGSEGRSGHHREQKSGSKELFHTSNLARSQQSGDEHCSHAHQNRYRQQSTGGKIA